MTLPRLREAHAHIAMHGRALSLLRLDDCASREQMLDRLARAAASLAPGEWLLACGVRAESFTDEPRDGSRWPTRDELDALLPARPCAVMSFDHHAVLANTAAFRAAGIDDGAPNPPGGVIVRDPRTASPTGLLLESAAWMAWLAAPEPDETQRRSHVRAALADLASHGFVEIHDLKSPVWLGPVLRELADAGDLHATVWLYPLLDDLDATLASAPSWEIPDRLLLAGAKVFADGTLNSRTAHTLTPFAHPIPDHPHGKALLTPADLRAAIARTQAAGIGLAVHAIGDAAVRDVLDAWEASPGARAARASPWHASARHDTPTLRIEHAELLDARDVPRFADLGVVASVQPCHLLTDIEVLEREFPDRLERVLPLRELIKAGCAPGALLWFGSDVPIVRPHPHDSLQAAVHRRRAADPPARAIAPTQALRESEAWACFAPSQQG